ncbi:MAG: hypothetical protein NPINA01_16050 [Nitrospinaceae bacterium]|nr:MAG: hypothetical protein NPINA01_16050 [Nitrospinaceae bacterium]
MPITNNNLENIPLQAIDRQDSLTDFSLNPVPDALKDSIQEIGVIHPVLLANSGDRFRIICGHRRVAACESLSLTEIPTLTAQSDLSDETLIKLNLTENRAHRSYSDVEKARVLRKLRGADVSEKIIIEKYMPLMGMERSKKWYEDLSAIDRLSPALQKLLHESNVPVRNFYPLLKWDAASCDAAESLFAVVRPGINKWRDLLELLDETARIENLSPAELLHREEIQTVLAQNDLQAHEKYDQIVQTIIPWRTPVLAGLRKKIAQTLDKLSLGPQTKIRIQESLEIDDIKIEIKGRDTKSLAREVDRLAEAARSDAMTELLRILKELK